MPHYIYESRLLKTMPGPIAGIDEVGRSPLAGQVVASVRLTPICIGETRALLLGPLTVEPPFRSHGVGTALVKRALQEAKKGGHKLVVLVGDEPIYAKDGFKRIPKGQVKMPGPVDPARLLVAELVVGAFDGVAGLIRPDWEPA